MVKLANTYGSEPYAERLEGSSPSLPTELNSACRSFNGKRITRESRAPE